MPELAKVLGLPSLVFFGTGLIVGAGIYTIIGAAAAESGDGLWAAFLLAAIVAGLSSLAYAELVSMYPRAGAEYEYLREAFPRVPILAGATGLVLTLSAIASVAAVAVAFGGSLRLFFDVPIWASALGLILVAMAFNIGGVRESAWVTILITIVELGGLLFVVYVGASGPGLSEGFGWSAPLALVGGVGLVFFAFLGFEDIANLAEESKDPTRDPPRAILISIFIAATIYVLVAVSVIALLPADELAASDSPLSAAVAKGPSWAPTAVGAIALFATGNTVLITMIAGSRILFAVARGGDIPGWLAKVSSGRKTPWVAALVVALASAVLLPFGGIAVLGATSSLSALAAFVMVDICVIRLRFTRPDVERPFRIWGNIANVPVFPVLGAVGAVAFAVQLGGEAYWITGGAAAVIAVLLWWGGRD